MKEWRYMYEFIKGGALDEINKTIGVYLGIINYPLFFCGLYHGSSNCLTMIVNLPWLLFCLVNHKVDLDPVMDATETAYALKFRDML
jgi:hypothetical protein